MDINEIIENISSQIYLLKLGNIPAMGVILNSLDDLEKNVPENVSADFFTLIQAMRHYLEQLILYKKKNTEPFEKGVPVLYSIWREISTGKKREVDLAVVLENLGGTSNTSDALPENDYGENEAHPSLSRGETSPKEEDIQLLFEFIAESREHLETIEVNLMEFEKKPQDYELINAINRPFHTIKGISGFLQLEKINILCHETENLTNSIRNDRLDMDARISNLILESVDTLTFIMDEIEKNLLSGKPPISDTIDITVLLKRIQQVIDTPAESVRPIGKILVEKGIITKGDLRDALKNQKRHPEKKLGQIFVEKKKAGSNSIAAALKEQHNSTRTAKHQVKVDTKKLDNLVDFTGELVIAQAMFRQVGLEMAIGHPKYFQRLNQVTQIVTDIQRISMSMRMVEIRNVFQKMTRVVRDLAQNTGKEVTLTVSGKETEIDRNMVEELYEPLVHMIRNSVDHGIELPDEREMAGKPRGGSIHLSAYQKSGNIVIEIEDDGRGLNTEKIREKAIQNGLVSQDEVLSEKEIFYCIFHPGFSTASQVTKVSGRGVGMDVVKKGIEKLSGRIEIVSDPGKGTRFTLFLPLTLAIIEGMLVRVGNEKYILPMHAIIESFRPTPKECHIIKGEGEMVMARGQLVPIVRIDSLFNLNGSVCNPWEGIVVVVEHEGKRKALLLDELLVKDEFVIKSIGDAFKFVKGLAGGAILSDGKVGLILDISGLFQIAERRCASS